MRPVNLLSTLIPSASYDSLDRGGKKKKDMMDITALKRAAHPRSFPTLRHLGAHNEERTVLPAYGYRYSQWNYSDLFGPFPLQRGSAAPHKIYSRKKKERTCSDTKGISVIPKTEKMAFPRNAGETNENCVDGKPCSHLAGPAAENILSEGSKTDMTKNAYRKKSFIQILMKLC